jgi:hypothetical protein
VKEGRAMSSEVVEVEFDGIGPRAAKPYRRGPPMGPMVFRWVLERLGLGTQRVPPDLMEALEAAQVRVALAPDQVAWMLRWPGIDGRQVRRMKSDQRRLAVPQEVADWLWEAVRWMWNGQPQEAYAVLALPPAPPPAEGRYWNRRLDDGPTPVMVSEEEDERMLRVLEEDGPEFGDEGDAAGDDGPDVSAALRGIL